MFRIIILLTAIAALLTCGCSAFREIFDESPDAHRAKMERREKVRKAKEDGHRFKDPVHDMFKVKNDAPVLPGSELSSYERQMIDAQRKSSFDDIENFKRENERARKARHDWVFGKNPFD